MTHSRFVFLFFISIASSISVSIFQCPQTANADDFYVSVDGDDDNPGTKVLPWRTVSASTLRLTPGDRLLIQPGEYRNEGKIFVRSVDPVTFQFFPLEGSAREVIQILGATDVAPKIYGSFDIRGSYIELSGLKVLGDNFSTDAGIAFFESHHVRVSECEVAFHGGGGINFNHSDVVRATRNKCYFNATTNPDQHSGISSFQPVVRTDTNERYGVIFYKNTSVGNRNEVPNSNGDVTDGNGIIIDDHFYTQFNDLLADVLAGTSDQEFSSGNPVIEIGADGSLLPYKRRTFVRQNICFFNGGRGIQVFLSDNVRVDRNTCALNLDSQALRDTLPTDAAGNPFFVFGEISLTDATDVIVSRNTALANLVDSAAGAELFFNMDGQESTNSWSGNFLENMSPDGPRVSVANSDSSDLLLIAE